MSDGKPNDSKSILAYPDIHQNTTNINNTQPHKFCNGLGYC